MQNADIKTYDVQIAGIPLRLKATHDQATVNEILQMVEDHFDTNSTKTSRQNSAILASLRLAEELYLLKRKTKAELDRLERIALDHLTHLQDS